MASIQPRGDKFQLRVKHPLLAKPFFWTFSTREEAAAYGANLEAMLDRGIVPIELMPKEVGVGRDTRSLEAILKAYRGQGSLSPSEDALLATMEAELRPLRMTDITYAWAEAYVKGLKEKRRLAPGSIRKRVGALARVIDWHHRVTTGRDQVNPLKLLPRGYSTYTARDEVPAKVDVVRDRRLLPAEEAAVRLALSGVKREGRERALVVDPALQLMFDLVLDTGLRLSEAYRLRCDQLGAGFLRVEGSKGHRGAVKPRTVPLKPALREKVEKWCGGRVGLMFPFWDGTSEGRKRATSNLSARFAVLFDYAGVSDFTEHDLRHEAACRWFELRDGQGRWALSEIEICRVMGWASTKMALRYASIRGEDLVERISQSTGAKNP